MSTLNFIIYGTFWFVSNLVLEAFLCYILKESLNKINIGEVNIALCLFNKA